MQSEPTEDEVQIEAMTTRFDDPPFALFDIIPDSDLPWFTLDAPPWTPMADFIPPVEMCGRCYDEFSTVGHLESSRCNEKPERLLGQPIGQYHCPDCGAMVLAGVPHPTVCHRCATRTHPSFD